MHRVSKIIDVAISDADSVVQTENDPALEVVVGQAGAKGDKGASIYDVDFDPQTGELIFYFTD